MNQSLDYHTNIELIWSKYILDQMRLTTKYLNKT